MTSAGSESNLLLLHLPSQSMHSIPGLGPLHGHCSPLCMEPLCKDNVNVSAVNLWSSDAVLPLTRAWVRLALRSCPHLDSASPR